MKNYEMMFIVKTTLEEAAVKNTVKEFSDIITSMNGKITNTKEMGQRELAYEIKKFRTGYYYVIDVQASNDKAIKEFDRLALINNDIIRHLITKKEA